MPKILEDLRQKIAAKQPGLSKGSTYAIATSALQKQGKLKPGTQTPTQNFCKGGKVLSTKRM